MLKIKNNEWKHFRNSTIIDIVWDLGCPIKYPKIEQNKYCMSFPEKEEEFNIEQERVDKINQERFDKFMEDIISWLKENKYID